ncbi:hypothetical protein [Oceanobacillus arenosus]|uniref:hypothetical protein n=1 Tax=Oceanobacillus arenosus TaxID=1229153 RepID=UPI0014752C5B|nr:hypothetical protein [Oceanobacillus arenosus]
MKAKDTIQDLMNNNIIARLKELGYTKVEGKSQRELIVALATLNVEVENPGQGWS